MTRLKFIFALAIILFSCNHSKPNFDLNDDAKLPDTTRPVITTASMASAYPQIFEAAFASGTEVNQSDIHYLFITDKIGKLKVESGKIIACDPIVTRDAEPFTQIFPEGEFPVDLAIAHTRNDERVAFSRILFSVTPVFKWEFALQRGQQQIPLADTSIYCYGVDAGTGIFIDSVANIALKKKDEKDFKYIFLTKAEENGYRRGYMHSFEEHNLATFSTGYGDGCYATYIGTDSAGNVCQLLTDFQLILWWNIKNDK